MTLGYWPLSSPPAVNLFLLAANYHIVLRSDCTGPALLSILLKGLFPQTPGIHTLVLLTFHLSGIVPAGINESAGRKAIMHIPSDYLRTIPLCHFLFHSCQRSMPELYLVPTFGEKGGHATQWQRLHATSGRPSRAFWKPPREQGSG